jgi:hypothetical protein
MALLNLPLSLCHKQENVYLNALMPKDPSLDEVNHFISPLVDQLHKSYVSGTSFTKTGSDQQRGRVTRSAVAVTVMDLPASRKIHGQGAHNCDMFMCVFCELHGKDTNNLNRTTWTPRNVADLRTAAHQWKDAKSQAERNALFKKNGVRWTELWRLPYYNPLAMISIDGMHALFERVIPFHLREVLGIDKSLADEKPVNNEDLAAAIKIYKSNPQRKDLTRLRQPVLQELCIIFHVSLPALVKGKKHKKADLISALQKIDVGRPPFSSLNLT